MHLPISRPVQHALVMSLCVLAVATFGRSTAATPATSSAPASSSSRSARTTATRAKLAAVRAHIKQIAAAQHATAARRDSINAKLAEQAAQLDQAGKALHATETAIAAKSAALAELQSRRTKVEKKLSGQRAVLASLVRSAYTLDQQSGLSLLLGNNNIAKTNRALAYSRYFQRARVQKIHALLGEVAKLDRIKNSIETAKASLQRQHNLQAAQAAALGAARAAQQRLLAQADAKLAVQKNQLATLQHHADALNALLKRLRNVFADIPAQLGKTASFATLRGKLPWPVQGKAHEGSGQLTHGLVIAAKPGTEVRAVAYGRVAWADFMRGYGMLVIIENGNGWLSLYGGNEAALVEVGDWVQPGQPIATVGANPAQGGAWFGLRHDGKPVDPRGWFISTKH